MEYVLKSRADRASTFRLVRRKRQFGDPDRHPDNSDYNPRIGKFIEGKELEPRISCRFLNHSESRWPASFSILYRYQAVVNDIIVNR
jgi:hypothetical protein